MSERAILIALLKAVLDSPTLSEQSNAVVVSGKIYQRIAEIFAPERK